MGQSQGAEQQSLVCFRSKGEEKLPGTQDASVVLMPTLRVPKDKLEEIKTYLTVIVKHKLNPKASARGTNGLT